MIQNKKVKNDRIFLFKNSDTKNKVIVIRKRLENIELFLFDFHKIC